MKPQSSNQIRHQVGQNPPDVWQILAQAAQGETMRQRCEQTAAGEHPAPAQVYAYVTHQLPDAEMFALEEHLAYCADCAQEALRIRLFEESADASGASEPNAPALCWQESESDVRQPERQAQRMPAHMRNGRAIKTIPERRVPFGGGLVHWLTDCWMPGYVGQVVTAANAPVRTRTFQVEDGEITVVCSWREAEQACPASVTIGWQANISATGDLWARFSDPERDDILAEVRLGRYLMGEETFTSADLGFDPAQQHWALAVALIQPGPTDNSVNPLM